MLILAFMLSVRGIIDPERDLGHIDRHRDEEAREETGLQQDAQGG